MTIYAGPESLSIGKRLSARRITLILVGLGLFVALFPLAFIQYEIHPDEAWLGQQAYELSAHGVVRTDLFRDAAPVNGRLVLYHKLLIWLGALVSLVVGWGLYPLRSVSLLSGIALIGLMLFRRSQGMTLTVRLSSVMVLVFTPLFVHQMIIFRPEMLVTLFGFAGYLLLERGMERSRLWMIAAAGLSAGLSGSAHAAGLSFAAAGLITLGFQRQLRAALIYLLCAAAGFFPYVSAFFTDRQLFLDQSLGNYLVATDLSGPWWRHVLWILDEHKRWFRNFEVVGISTLFLLALLQQNKQAFRQQRIFWTYVAALAVVLAALPISKMARYLLPLVPFFAVVIAWCWHHSPQSTTRRVRYARYAFIGWTFVLLGIGVYDLAYQAIVHRNDQIATNKLLATQIPPQATVMAPWDFVFEEQPRYTIQSYSGAWRIDPGLRTGHRLEAYADSCGVDYMIFDSGEISRWTLDTTNLAREFTHFVPLAGAPAQDRWLVGRAGASHPR